MSDNEFKRVNFRIPADVKEWYEKQAERNCMSMSSALAVALIEKYDREQNAMAMRKMAEMKVDDSTKNQMSELIELFKNIPTKE